jgi:hypothetical protein
VLLEVGLPQAVAGPVGQGRYAVGLHVEHRRDFPRLPSVDVKVPQHLLPTLRQRGEGLLDEFALEPVGAAIAERH